MFFKLQVYDPARAGPHFNFLVQSAKETGSKVPQLAPVGYLFHLWQKRALKCPPPCHIETALEYQQSKPAMQHFDWTQLL